MTGSHLRSLVRAVVLVIVAVAAFSVFGDVRALAGRLATFDPRAFVVAIALASANYGIRFVRWQYYLRRIDVHVPWRDSLRIFLAGFVMSISPAKIGEVLKSALLYEQHRIDPARTAPIVLAERITDLFALVLLVALGSLELETGGPIAAAGGAVVLVAWLVCASPKLGGAIIDRIERLPRGARIAPRLRDAHTALRTVVGPGALFFATSLATSAWWLECVALKVLVDGFDGAHVGLLQATFAYAAPTIAGALALLPGGLVVTEAGMAGSLETMPGVGLTPGVATAATVLVRLATLWWAVLVGFVALAAHRRVMRTTVDAYGTTSPAPEAISADSTAERISGEIAT